MNNRRIKENVITPPDIIANREGAALSESSREELKLNDLSRDRKLAMNLAAVFDL